ncbi:MAG: hypothetical protein HOP11_02700 [Saprospiraceae bacterium]|nr:hypothetical protein [Saprospiraceae bacterium]
MIPNTSEFVEFKEIQLLNIDFMNSNPTITPLDSILLTEIANSNSINRGFARGILLREYNILINDPLPLEESLEPQIKKEINGYKVIELVNGQNVILVKDPQKIKKNISIFDILGRKRFELETSSEVYEIELSYLPKELLIIVVESKNEIQSRLIYNLK